MNFSAGCVMKQTDKVFLQHRSSSRKRGVRLRNRGNASGPLPKRQRAQTRAERGKALYDSHRWAS